MDASAGGEAARGDQRHNCTSTTSPHAKLAARDKVHIVRLPCRNCFGCAFVRFEHVTLSSFNGKKIRLNLVVAFAD